MVKEGQVLPANVLGPGVTGEAPVGNRTLTGRTAGEGAVSPGTATKLISRTAGGPGSTTEQGNQPLLTGRAGEDAAVQVVVGPGKRDTGVRVPKAVNGHPVDAHNPGNGTGRDTGEPDQRRGTPPEEPAAPARQPGPGGEPPSPPEDLTTEASGDDPIQRILERNKEALTRWQSQHRGEPSLALTEEAAKGLIPRRILELVDDPEAITLRIDPASGRNNLRLVVVEERPEQITNKESFDSALTAGQNTCPDDVDPMIWKDRARFEDLVENGTIGERDKPLFFAMLSTIGPTDTSLYVDYISVREELRKKGVAGKAYDGLRQFALDQNFPAILGESDPTPAQDTGISIKDIFLGMGLKSYADLPRQLQTEIFEGYPRVLHLAWLVVDDLSRPSATDASPTPRPDSSANPGNPAGKGAESREPRTLVERHAGEWPEEIHAKIFYSPHSTVEDMAGMRSHLGDADIFLYEDILASEGVRNELQRAANMAPETSVNEFLVRLNQEIINDGRDSLFGTAYETMLRSVYGTGVVVAHFDIRTGDAITREEIEDTLAQSYMTGDFNQTLTYLGEILKTHAVQLNQRDEVTINEHLEEELVRIFASHHELKEVRGRPLNLFITRGSTHEGTFDDQLRQQGISTEILFPEGVTTYVTPENHVLRKFMSGEEPSRDELAQALLEKLLKHHMTWSQTEPFRDNKQLLAYFHHVVPQFKTEDIAEIHALEANSELNIDVLDSIFARISQERQIVLPPLPVDNDELREALASFESNSKNSDNAPRKNPGTSENPGAEANIQLFPEGHLERIREIDDAKATVLRGVTDEALINEINEFFDAQYQQATENALRYIEEVLIEPLSELPPEDQWTPTTEEVSDTERPIVAKFTEDEVSEIQDARLALRILGREKNPPFAVSEFLDISKSFPRSRFPEKDTATRSLRNRRAPVACILLTAQAAAIVLDRLERSQQLDPEGEIAGALRVLAQLPAKLIRPTSEVAAEPIESQVVFEPARPPKAHEVSEIVSSFDSAVAAVRNLESEHPRLGQSLDRSVAESTDLPLDVAHDFLVIDRVTRALAVALGPEQVPNIEDIDSYRSAVFNRINRAIGTADLTPTEKLLFGMHLGLPPTMSEYETMRIRRRSTGQIIHYESYYQWTQNEKNGRDLQTIRDGLFRATDMERIQEIFDSAVSKVQAEMLAEG